MIDSSKQLSNPISTGGLGNHFENRVQASFVLLMLTGGYSPCLPNWPIYKIKLQGKYKGFNTDDLIVFTKKINSDNQAKLLAQIKHTISVTNSSEKFGEVITSAWNDFNNKDLFDEGNDILALICGPLSNSDTDGVRNLINCAVHSENANDFIDRIEKAKFTSNEQRNKFVVFKTHLRTANKGTDLTKNQLWRFLKSFRLLIYDLDIKGVTLSLLHTLIEQHSQNNANSMWTQIQEHVQWENEQAGFITISSISEEISSVFKRTSGDIIPPELIKGSPDQSTKDWSYHPHANEIAIMCLLGSWNENFDEDKNITCRLSQLEYDEWISIFREVLHQPESPVSLNNGIWRIKDRKKVFQLLGSRIFDQTLDNFKECIIHVLQELDPKYELPKDTRYTASLHGKVLIHSQSLRLGLSGGLALIGNSSLFLSNCSSRKLETILILSIREIFKNADWKRWATLNDLLPVIAEAMPNEFIKTVESTLLQIPCPFDELFAQEGSGITGWNYITGLLWALETLAWEEEYLVRVTMILGELTKHDPGGTWSNRPSNTLITIYLPWFPQTIASFDKRKIAVLNLKKELPDVTFRFLTSLLPNKQQSSSGTHRPLWRNSIPDGWSVKVSPKEYWEQVDFYANQLVELAIENFEHIDQIINNLDNLPLDSFYKILQYLTSDDVLALPEEKKYDLWSKMIDTVTKHKHFARTKWALSSDLVTKIEEVAKKLTPLNPTNLHRRLFNGRDYNLYEDKTDWQTLQKHLEERRLKGLKEILDFNGINGVLDFVEKVESPTEVGHTFGLIDDNSFDAKLFPAFLDTENKKIEQFICAFIWSKHRKLGWLWVDDIKKDIWTITQISKFYSCLPFVKDTWDRVNKSLSDSEVEYWNKVTVNPYFKEIELSTAIDKLIYYGRPNAAINCIHKSIHDAHPVDNKIILKALMSAISTKEPSYTMDVYHIVELIKFLQKDETTNTDDLFNVEWAYLQLLDNNYGVRPKILENTLAINPNFFCELIQLVYRSKNTPDSIRESSENEKLKALNAYRLLNEWHTVPGINTDGTFSYALFFEWLNQTKEICSISGHLEIALLQIGKVLIYCPADINGLWINEAVAEELNRKESESMRDGFCTAIFNSRGVHFVDPSGTPEKELANKYRQQATEVENKGYYRFATSLRNLAQSYDKDADRLIEEHKLEK
jgi:hypothetical protein